MKKHIKQIIVGVIIIIISTYVLYKIPPQTLDDIFKNIIDFLLLPYMMPVWEYLLLLFFVSILYSNYVKYYNHLFPKKQEKLNHVNNQIQYQLKINLIKY